MMLLNSMCGILSLSLLKNPTNPAWYLIQLLFLLPIYDNLIPEAIPWMAVGLHGSLVGVKLVLGRSLMTF